MAVKSSPAVSSEALEKGVEAEEEAEADVGKSEVSGGLLSRSDLWTLARERHVSIELRYEGPCSSETHLTSAPTQSAHSFRNALSPSSVLSFLCTTFTLSSSLAGTSEASAEAGRSPT